jgi:hypothetical protein
MAPTQAFDFWNSQAIQQQWAIPADSKDLVRIKVISSSDGALGQSDSRVVGSRRRLPMITARSILFSFTRTLAKATKSGGATWGAAAETFRATPSHSQPLSPQLDITSGYVRHHQATQQMCLLSSGSRVRILPGALISNTCLAGTLDGFDPQFASAFGGQ